MVFLLALLRPGYGAGLPQDTSDHTKSEVNRIRLTAVIVSESLFYLAGLASLQYIWYKDHEVVPFHFYNDNAGWLQLDKAGHGFSAYYQSMMGYEALRWCGVSKKKALIFGGSLGFLLQTPIEVFDGIYEGYGFSSGDIVANTLGSVLFVVQQVLWDDQIVRMKFSYAPSDYPQYLAYFLGETPLQRFFMDYNGHTYWLSANLKKITGIDKLPNWLNMALGYSGNGMLKEFQNPVFFRGKPIPFVERYRQYLFSLDIDISKIPTRHRGLKTIFNWINMVKIPFPAVEINRVEGLKIRPVYF